jgi:hypothetical protein
MRLVELVPVAVITLVSDRRIISALPLTNAAILISKLHDSPDRLSELQFCISKDSGLGILAAPVLLKQVRPGGFNCYGIYMIHNTNY